MTKDPFIKDVADLFNKCAEISTAILEDQSKYKDYLSHGKVVYLVGVFQAVLKAHGYLPETVDLNLLTRDSQVVEATAPWDFNVAKDQAAYREELERKRKLRDRLLRKKQLKMQV